MKQRKKIMIAVVCFLLLIPATKVSAATYKISENDTLYKLSKLYKTSVANLKATNPPDSSTLIPGSLLFVPAHIHKVKSGDTMYTIAKKYGIPLANLKTANKKYSKGVKPGNKLIIPGIKPNKTEDAVIPYVTGEVTLLAKLIEAEAGGETYQAKIAVGAVVINRVQSGDWAPTITKVIYQKFGEYYQFSPVKNGMINKPASAESLKAAWAAMYGSDPSDGAIYYFDNTSTNNWLWAKPKTAYLDSLIFAE